MVDDPLLILISHDASIVIKVPKAFSIFLRLTSVSTYFL
ncbi:hypothetical protein HVS_13075 [Acetivibrio saccincola]|jgi:hypothetical protein|uniref:Uncharacterized protein n=1 Tax=Acetivibrio saccincola TaxID=1677857 RepID=A0A2K9E433_9FIRM|nr:hypothetical protein HVS_13075 [Acetivibrio saccincola]